MVKRYSGYTVQPFRAAHLIEIHARNGIPGIDMVALGREYEKHPSITGRTAEGVIAACGGVRILWPGVGECWGFTSHELERYKIAWYRTVKTLIESTALHFNLHRMHCAILDGDTKAAEFIARLQFRRGAIDRWIDRYGMPDVLYSQENQAIGVAKIA